MWNSTVLKRRHIREGDDRITVEIPGVTDADKILNDLGKPGSLCFIEQTDKDGNQNFIAGEKIMYSQEALMRFREAGSVVLEGTDVADAEGGAYQSDKRRKRVCGQPDAYK
ncbi:MAG: hypothetical protein ACLRIT_12060 [Blautia sp.]